jgi:hypothetical protein
VFRAGTVAARVAIEAAGVADGSTERVGTNGDGLVTDDAPAQAARTATPSPEDRARARRVVRRVCMFLLAASLVRRPQ